MPFQYMLLLCMLAAIASNKSELCIKAGSRYGSVLGYWKKQVPGMDPIPVFGYYSVKIGSGSEYGFWY